MAPWHQGDRAHNKVLSEILHCGLVKRSRSLVSKESKCDNKFVMVEGMKGHYLNGPLPR